MLLGAVEVGISELCAFVILKVAKLGLRTVNFLLYCLLMKQNIQLVNLIYKISLVFLLMRDTGEGLAVSMKHTGKPKDSEGLTYRSKLNQVILPQFLKQQLQAVFISFLVRSTIYYCFYVMHCQLLALPNLYHSILAVQQIVLLRIDAFEFDGFEIVGVGHSARLHDPYLVLVDCVPAECHG